MNPTRKCKAHSYPPELLSGQRPSDRLAKLYYSTIPLFSKAVFPVFTSFFPDMLFRRPAKKQFFLFIVLYQYCILKEL